MSRLTLLSALISRLEPSCPNLPPTALRSSVVFSELLPTAKTGMSTDALLSVIEAMRSGCPPPAPCPRLEPIHQATVRARQQQRRKHITDHAHPKHHGP